MTQASPTGQVTASDAAGGLGAERGIEAGEILPGHLGYRSGQGRASRVRTVTTAGAGSKYGLGKPASGQGTGSGGREQ
jgi:hypothetical protein